MQHIRHVLDAHPASGDPARGPRREAGMPRPHGLRTTAPLIALLALAAVLLLALAPAALAAPPGPTMDLTQLGAALQSGPLDGYLLTTMSGTTPEKIPLQVQSLVEYSDGTLILFEASGPVIDKLGGIAAGMSGSPVYVTVGGSDYLVGALSYGDIFTRGGTGLATPIEYMSAIETTYPVGAAGAHTAATPQPGAYKLTTPVATDTGAVRKVVIAKSVTAGQQLSSSSDQPVVAPLGIIEIGGARPGSKAYDRVAAKFASTGMLVRPASGDGTWAGAPTPSLEPGSPCAILFSQGAVWVGAAGTVTYVDGASAMIFGHPFDQLGAIDAAFTGGYVDGAWPSNIEPYKLIAPRDVKGTCVQDRAWGVEAHLGGAPSLFPVHTTVHYDGRSIDDSSAVDQWLFTSQAYPELPADIASELAYRLIDQSGLPGSVTTRTTVVVSDSTGSYTVQRDDLWSDSYDVSYDVGSDAATALDGLSANPDGTLAPHIDSVTVQADISSAQRSARIAAVDLPEGLHTGANRIVVSYYAYGSSTLQTLTATLDVPAGMPLTGRLSVTPGSYTEDDFMDLTFAARATRGATAAPETLAEVVADLNAAPRNSDLVVSYSAGGDDALAEVGATSDNASVTVPTDYVFSEPFYASATLVTLKAQQRAVNYGGSVHVSGFVDSSSDVPVDIYRRGTSQADPVLVTTVTAHAVQGRAVFSAVVPRMRRTADILAVASAGDGTVAGRAKVRVAVRAQVRLSGGAPLSIRVRPATSGTAVVQRKSGGRWVDFRSARIVDGAGTVRLPAGTWTVRARFPGNADCASGMSQPVTVTVH